jgi:uncharacterized phage infection (PIP) family protein YhgE
MDKNVNAGQDTALDAEQNVPMDNAQSQNNNPVVQKVVMLLEAYKSMAERVQQQEQELSELREFVQNCANKNGVEPEQLLKDERANKYFDEKLKDYQGGADLDNDELKAILKEAYSALGEDLDVEKFMDMLDKYVEARLENYEKEKSIEKENEQATDKLQFEYGSLTKPAKLPRMQDIPADELEKYIAKYI